MTEKTTFGRHLEYGLTYLGDRIHATIIDAKDHELETINLGLMPDEEKLRFLKQDLYRAVRARANSEHVTDLIRAIATLEASIQAKHQRDNDFIGKFNQISNTALVLLFLATLASYFAISFCGDSKKPICTNSTQIARYLNKQFIDPK